MNVIIGILMLLGMAALDKIDPALNIMLAVIGGIWALLVFGARLFDRKPTDPTLPSDKQLAEQNARRECNRRALEGKFDNSWFGGRAP